MRCRLEPIKKKTKQKRIAFKNLEKKENTLIVIKNYHILRKRERERERERERKRF